MIIQKKIYFKGATDLNILEVVKKALLSTSQYEYQMCVLYLQNYLDFPENLSTENKSNIISLAIKDLKKQFSSNIDRITKGKVEKSLKVAYKNHLLIQKNLYFIVIPSKIYYNPDFLDEISLKGYEIKLISSNPTLGIKYFTHNIFRHVAPAIEQYLVIRL